MLRNRSVRLDRENYWKGRSEAIEVDPRINVFLEAEDVICPKCRGKGIYPVELDDEREYCDKCYGDKKFDWIERITGKPTPEWVECSTSSSTSSTSQSSYTVSNIREVQKPFEKHLKDYIDKMGENIKLAIDRNILGMFKYTFGTKYKKEKEEHF